MEIKYFTDEMLVGLARDSRANAHAPYSKFSVGAACRAESGIAYMGCNVENMSYPVGVCAERVAVSSAIAHGEKKIKALALAGGPENSLPDKNIRPCGMCLQFISEFMDPDGIILIAADADKITQFTLVDLLPDAFTLPGSDGND